MRKFFIRSTLVGFIVTLFAAFFLISNVHADEPTQTKTSYEIDDKELYDLTNTYNYKEKDPVEYDGNWLEKIKNYFSSLLTAGEERYDLSKENGNKVNTDCPQITVITHGWMGHADSWDDKFKGSSFDDNSVVQKIFDNYDFSDVFLARFTDDKNFNFYNITSNYRNKLAITKTNISPVSNNFSCMSNKNHTIIVFESDNSNVGHEYVYNQFNYMLSAAILQIRKLNDNKLPKVNLIGHSRGGLTNLQYALDHPKLVENMISYDTPYLGTTTGELAICNALSEDLYSYFADRESLIGIGDLTSTYMINKFYNRWDSGYDKYYDDINVHAYSSKTRIKFLNVDSFLDYVKETFENTTFVKTFKNSLESSYDAEFADRTILQMIDSVTKAVGDGITAVAKEKVASFVDFVQNFDFIKFAKDVWNNICNFFKTIGDTIASWFTGNNKNDEMINNIAELTQKFIELVGDEMHIEVYDNYKVDIVWNSDVAVDYDSQRGIKGDKAYKGFNRSYTKSYDFSYTETIIAHERVLKDNYFHNNTLKILDLPINLYVDNTYVEKSMSLSILSIEKRQKLLVEYPSYMRFETVGSLNTYISVYDSNGKLIRSDDNSGEGNNALLDLYLSKGVYYIGVKCSKIYNFGSTKLRISYAPSAIQLSYELYITGKMEYLRYFIPSVSGTYTIETKGSNVDTYMRLYDSNMNQITYNDDGGEGNNALITWYLTAGQKYYIGVSGYNKYKIGLTSLTFSKGKTNIYTGNTTVSNYTVCTYTAPTRQLVFIETLNETDTQFFSIISQAKYDYNDDTMIYDDDGDYEDMDAWIGVVLEAGQSISFVAYNRYGSTSTINVSAYNR